MHLECININVLFVFQKVNDPVKQLLQTTETLMDEPSPTITSPKVNVTPSAGRMRKYRQNATNRKREIESDGDMKRVKQAAVSSIN